jgi:serine/threonine-protein kinase RsbW
VAEGEPERALELDLPAVPESCPQARSWVREVLVGEAVDQGAIDLAVSEAVTNAVVHAYRDRARSDEPGRVRVAVVVDDDGLWVTVSDEGGGMAPRPDSPGLGLGLPLMTQNSEELEIEQMARGTRVRMRFGVRGDAGAAVR